MFNFVGFDIETAPCEGQPQPYALQPWRAKEGLARITLAAIATADGSSKLCKGYIGELRNLIAITAPKPLVTWNGIFDAAWLISYGLEEHLRSRTVLDAMLLWKILENGQRHELMPDWSLAAGAKRWLRGKVVWYEDFMQLKAVEVLPGAHDPYWEIRCKLDALATATIAEMIWPKLTTAQQRLAKIECRAVLPVAASWVNGVVVNTAKAVAMAPAVIAEMREIEHSLGVVTQPKTKKEREKAIDGWIQSKILSSPKQLAELLYDKWGLTCEVFTEKKQRSSAKSTLTYLADYDARAIEVLRWRVLNTQYTKFILGAQRSKDYLHSDTSHPGPKLFSTYTGRMTYSTKSGRKGEAAKAKVGVPLHQWPRAKQLRELVEVPEGEMLIEADAAGQEARIMALQSGDVGMLDIFSHPSPLDDLHSNTGAGIAGISFDEFIARKNAKDPEIVGPHGLRYCGKYINLSKQYRVGNKKSRIIARVQYGLVKDLGTIEHWDSVYHAKYPGVKQYWRNAIIKARTLGYAETLGGRRFKIEFWGKEDKWKSESSAINFPIQGTGADMKELAIATVYGKFPELLFMMDLHDGIFYRTKITPHLQEMMRDLRSTLNNLNYTKAWDYTPSIPLPWDVQYGTTWGSMRPL